MGSQREFPSCKLVGSHSHFPCTLPMGFLGGWGKIWKMEFLYLDLVIPQVLVEVLSSTCLRKPWVWLKSVGIIWSSKPSSGALRSSRGRIQDRGSCPTPFRKVRSLRSSQWGCPHLLVLKYKFYPWLFVSQPPEEVADRQILKPRFSRSGIGLPDLCF